MRPKTDTNHENNNHDQYFQEKAQGFKTKEMMMAATAVTLMTAVFFRPIQGLAQVRLGAHGAA